MIQSLRRGVSIQQRMLEAIRQHFLASGDAPSHRELAIICGVRRNSVGGILGRLAKRGLIVVTPGVQRGIVLPDRTEMLSVTEVQLWARRNGWTLSPPKVAVLPLVEAYRPETGTDCGLSLDAILADIDAAEQGVSSDDARADRGRAER